MPWLYFVAVIAANSRKLASLVKAGKQWKVEF
jgi:hypothetical protein